MLLGFVQISNFVKLYIDYQPSILWRLRQKIFHCFCNDVIMTSFVIVEIKAISPVSFKFLGCLYLILQRGWTTPPPPPQCCTGRKKPSAFRVNIAELNFFEVEIRYSKYLKAFYNYRNKLNLFNKYIPKNQSVRNILYIANIK